jgi:DNA-binding transcriptional LysR family regulator
MNLRQIEAFRAIIETGTVGRAAERLSISQPAVTKLLQHLESTIGFALFDRRRGRLSPTAEAMMLYDEVERVFRGLDDLARFTSEIRTLQHGALRIGTMPALSIGFIQDLVARFIETRPAIRVSIQTRTSPKLVDWLVSGHLDVGFTSHPPDHPEVTSELLCSTELVCILPREHRLTSKSVVHAADFAGEQFISFGPDSPYRHRLDDIFNKLGVEIGRLYEAPMAPAVCAMVARGMGVAILNPHFLGAFESLVAVRPFLPGIVADLRMVVPRYRRQPLITQAFIREARLMFGAAAVRAIHNPGL